MTLFPKQFDIALEPVKIYDLSEYEMSFGGRRSSF
jgi:hypothetical protein